MSVRGIEIPKDTAFFRLRVELSGTNYLFDFKYNQREDAFYLEILTEVGDHLLGPKKLVANWPILKWHRYVTALPPGELVCVDNSGNVDTPGMGVLGQSVPLWYLDPDSIAELST